MNQIVYNYLNRYYYVDKPLRVNWILDKDSSKTSSFNELTNNLVTIFSLHKEVVIYLITNWVHEFYPQKDLTNYYNYNRGGIFYNPIPLDNYGVIQIVR